MFGSRELRWLVMGCFVVGLMLAAGCNRAKYGTKRGEKDIYDTTTAETRSSEVLPVALIAFSDQVPETLCKDLAHLPVVRDTAGPVTVIVGDMENKTRKVPTTDFEMMASRIRNELIQSGAREKLRFVERRARMQKLAAKERVASDEQLADAPDYDPQTTYALTGSFYQIKRDNVQLYYMEFQLVHFASNQIVFSDKYDVKQVN